MKIYFAISNKEEFTSSTSLTEIANFFGYNAETLRRAFRESSSNVIELRKGKVYKSELIKISGRGGFMIENIRH